jgi:hypothetical protein
MSDRGSATTELVILAPVLVLLAVAALVLGRLVLFQEQIADAARSAVEAAAVWPTPRQAEEAALLTASYDIVRDGALRRELRDGGHGRFAAGRIDPRHRHMRRARGYVLLSRDAGSDHDHRLGHCTHRDLPGGRMTSAPGPSVHRVRRVTDSGAVVAYVVLLSSTLAVVLGLAVGGGQALAAHTSAYDEAEQAARAGAATLAASGLRSGDIETDAAAAVEVAQSFMTTAGHPGVATVLGNLVSATVSPYRVATPLLAIAGISSLTVSASASATAVAG